MADFDPTNWHRFSTDGCRLQTSRVQRVWRGPRGQRLRGTLQLGQRHGLLSPLAALPAHPKRQAVPAAGLHVQPLPVLTESWLAFMN